MNKTILSTAIFIWLACSNISTRAEDASFSAFLAQMKEVNAINIEAFGDWSFESDTCPVLKSCERFIPNHIKHSCRGKEFSWHPGNYMRINNVVVVLWQRLCTNHQDRFKGNFMESWLFDYIIATYTPEGNLIDARPIGYVEFPDGMPYLCEMNYDSRHYTVTVDQSEMADATQAYKYEDYVYLSRRYRYSIGKKGNIKCKAIGKERKKIVYNKDAHCDPMPFCEFLSYFERWDKPYEFDSLFHLRNYRLSLWMPSFYKLTSDTIDRRSLPAKIMWRPCRYMETESEYHFFVIADSGRPIHGYPYSDYIKLVFTKDGVYRRAEHMGFWSEDGEKIIW